MEGSDAVGWRVSIYWPEEEEWYDGCITEFDQDQGYYVLYDDGEEQWELFRDKEKVKFLEPTEDKPLEEDGVEEPPTPCVADSKVIRDDVDLATPDFEFDDDSDSEKEEDEKAVQRSSRSAVMHQRSRVPRQLEHKKAVFHRDREDLLDMKSKLLAQKKILISEKDTLSVRISMADQVTSAARKKRDLLSSRDAVENLPSTVRRTKADASEQVLDLKVLNRTITKANSQLQNQCEEASRRVNYTKKQVRALQEKFDKLPLQDRQSKKDLQDEISRLTQEKLDLEATGKNSVSKSNRHPTLATLESELDKLKQTLATVRSERAHWQQLYDRENAKIIPLKERLAALESNSDTNQSLCE